MTVYDIPHDTPYHRAAAFFLSSRCKIDSRRAGVRNADKFKFARKAVYKNATAVPFACLERTISSLPLLPLTLSNNPRDSTCAQQTRKMEITADALLTIHYGYQKTLTHTRNKKKQGEREREEHTRRSKAVFGGFLSQYYVSTSVRFVGAAIVISRQLVPLPPLPLFQMCRNITFRSSRRRRLGARRAR